MSKPLPTPRTYPDLLGTLKARIHEARLRTAVSVNQELILLYWDIGVIFCCGRRRKVGGLLSLIAWLMTYGGIFPI